MDTETALLALNGVVYASLAAGLVLVMKGRRSAPRGRTPIDSLTEAMKMRFPDLPPGFTLREGLARAQQLRLDLDWKGVESSLSAYEQQRYGSGEVSQYPELVDLRDALRRSSR